MFALLLIAILAALALPGLGRPMGTGLLRASALQVAALLRSDRTAAMESGRTVTTKVNVTGTAVRSGGTGSVLNLPRGVEALSSGVEFRPDGRTSGGAIALRAAAAIITIHVDPITGAISATHD
jgi:general secretion pathway protein H